MKLINKVEQIGKDFIKEMNYSKETVDNSGNLFQCILIVNMYIKFAHKEAIKHGWKNEIPEKYKSIKEEFTKGFSTFSNPIGVRKDLLDSYNYLLKILNFLKKQKVKTFIIKRSKYIILKKKLICDVEEEIEGTKNLIKQNE